MTTSQPGEPHAFTIGASQNPYLAEDGDLVEAVLTVTAVQSVRAAQVRLLLGFVLDVSGSMAGDRIEAVRAAVQSAIGLLDERSDFFVVTFSQDARQLVPPMPATQANRSRAIQAVGGLQAGGGTAMSQGLAMARSVFQRAPDAIRQGLFLTDGYNESEDAADVEVELRRCAGLFTCECWGVGTQWRIGEVQAIARALLGRATIIPEPGGIEAEFRAAVDAARAKAVRDVRLRIWSPTSAQVVFLKQVSPTIEDLNAHAVQVSPRERDYATGAWGPGESRDYLLALRVTPGALGERLLAARPRVVYRRPDGGDAGTPDARILVEWTTDPALFSRLDSAVAHYTGQEELAFAIKEGLAAREEGDTATATELLGRAVRLASESGHTGMTALLQKVVDVQPGGTVLLKQSPNRADTMNLELEATTTQRLGPPRPPPRGPPPPRPRRLGMSAAPAPGPPEWEVTIVVDPTLDLEPNPAIPPPTDQGERSFPIDMPAMLVGRRDDDQSIRPQIPVLDPAVSRRHARLEWLADGGLVIRDLASANGTAVNRSPLVSGKPHPLRDGDEVTMGRWTRIKVRRLKRR